MLPMVPLATNGTIGKISNGTIGRIPNARLDWTFWTRQFRLRKMIGIDTTRYYSVQRDQDNSPQRQLAPRQLAPKKTRPKTTRPTFRRQLAPYSVDNSPHSEDNSPELVLTCYYLKIKLNSFRRPAALAYR